MKQNDSSRFPDFQIVMATYNGEKFVDKQIESIAQQLAGGELLIHDDGSTDRTADIISEWSQADDRIRVIPSQPKGGARDNFSFLLSLTTAPFVFLADQDDIWEPDKIANMLKLISFYDDLYDSEKPLLLHSDLKVIDERDNELAKSFWNYQNLDPAWSDKLNLILTQNVVTGCASVVNRRLLDISLPIPKEAEMHDWWLALNACAYGRIMYTPTPLIRYRKHATNVIGADKFSLVANFRKFKGIFDTGSEKLEKAKSSEKSLYSQAEAFYVSNPQSRYASTAQAFSNLNNRPYLLRCLSIVRYGFYQKGLLRNVIWFLKPRETLGLLKNKLRRLF